MLNRRDLGRRGLDLLAGAGFAFMGIGVTPQPAKERPKELQRGQIWRDGDWIGFIRQTYPKLVIDWFNDDYSCVGTYDRSHLDRWLWGGSMMPTLHYDKWTYLGHISDLGGK